MFYSITWQRFSQTMLLLTAGYYILICLLFYRRELLRFLRRHNPILFIATIPLLARSNLYAQTADGNNGLNQANTMVRGYFDTAVQLTYAIAAIMGLIGAIRIAFRRNREDMGHEIAIWFGTCIFLVIVATVLKAFFGL
ncbi:MAG TPA: DUF4134 domain-containing protein [Puia sp.]|nr:DUF4134 domain-containing protein [Puia sp.]